MKLLNYKQKKPGFRFLRIGSLASSFYSRSYEKASNLCSADNFGIPDLYKPVYTRFMYFRAPVP